MRTPEPKTTDPAARHSLFVTTRWSTILKARDQSAPGSAEALESLCGSYWYPLYAFVRRQGRSPHDAQDLTQAFFARLLQKDYLQSAAREKGRFRTFLIVALKRFLANEWDRARAQKRGGGRTFLSFDNAEAERRYEAEPSDGSRADRIYERRWALTLLEQALRRLREDYERTNRSGDYENLKPFLAAERGTIPYVQIASELGTSEGAARVLIHRLRKQFRVLFREEIAQTVSDPAEVDDEVRYVVSVLSATE